MHNFHIYFLCRSKAQKYPKQGKEHLGSTMPLNIKPSFLRPDTTVFTVYFPIVCVQDEEDWESDEFVSFIFLFINLATSMIQTSGPKKPIKTK